MRIFQISNRVCQWLSPKLQKSFTQSEKNGLLFNYKSLQKYSTTKTTTKTTTETAICNVGTIGHVDHGKTTLTSAITKYLSVVNGSCNYVDYDEIDRAPEEKARGITINIAHVGYATQKRRYAHTDCPGHLDFVKNMISGASQMDGAILVIAADDGPMPQTREHLLLVKQLGINHVVVFINKADLADKEMLELIELETIDLLSHFGFDSEKTPFISGSAKLALNGDTSEYGLPSIQKLLDAVDEHIPTPVRNVDGPFILPIDNAISVRGRGTVVVGTLKQGTLKKNSEAHLVGFDREIKTSVADIQVFKQSVPVAIAGENVGALIRNVKFNDVKRGMILCKYNSFKITNHYEGQIYLLTTSEGGRSKPIQKSGYCGQLFTNTMSIYTRLDLLLPENNVMLMPGEHATARLTTLKKMPMTKGQTFTLRELNQRTVITGIITNTFESIHFDKKRMDQVVISVA